jgi:hypothetical protein
VDESEKRQFLISLLGRSYRSTLRIRNHEWPESL